MTIQQVNLNSLPSYPKIWSLGKPELEMLFNSPVEITEKVDGSQFGFGKLNGEVFVRSKGVPNIILKPNKMFSKAVDYIMSIKNKLREGAVYYAEYLENPKHNTLNYERVPKNNLALFAVAEPTSGVMKWVVTHTVLNFHAKSLNIDVVPLLYWGMITERKQFEKYLNKRSFLGGETVEGVVIKNYKDKSVNPYSSECFGKFVSQKFKERNHKVWDEKKGPSISDFIESFKSEARWDKALQHLRDDNLIEYDFKDIGKLIKTVQEDVSKEEENTIKDQLYKFYKKQILMASIKGLPIWYKEKLLKRQFDDKKSS